MYGYSADFIDYSAFFRSQSARAFGRLRIRSSVGTVLYSCSYSTVVAIYCIHYGSYVRTCYKPTMEEPRDRTSVITVEPVA